MDRKDFSPTITTTKNSPSLVSNLADFYPPSPRPVLLRARSMSRPRGLMAAGLSATSPPPPPWLHAMLGNTYSQDRHPGDVQPQYQFTALSYITWPCNGYNRQKRLQSNKTNKTECSKQQNSLFVTSRALFMVGAPTGKIAVNTLRAVVSACRHRRFR